MLKFGYLKVIMIRNMWVSHIQYIFIAFRSVFLGSTTSTLVGASSSSETSNAFAAIFVTCRINSCLQVCWSAAWALLIHTGRKNSKVDLSCDHHGSAQGPSNTGQLYELWLMILKKKCWKRSGNQSTSSHIVSNMFPSLPKSPVAPKPDFAYSWITPRLCVLSQATIIGLLW